MGLYADEIAAKPSPMTRIPTSALGLGLAGLLPFLWAALNVLIPASSGSLIGIVSPAFTGTALMAVYGTVILSFMSGVIWGFATKAEGRVADAAYLMSVMPALYAMALLPAPERAALIGLAIGFLALLIVDYWALRQKLAPRWWLKLRLLLTSVVVLCLAVGAFA